MIWLCIAVMSDIRMVRYEIITKKNRYRKDVNRPLSSRQGAVQ